MLTILHRHDDGTESVYEAASVSRLASDQPSIPPCGDLELRGCHPGLYVGPGAMSTSLDGTIVIKAGCQSANGFDPTVFVMNRFGATVATYRMGSCGREFGAKAA